MGVKGSVKRAIRVMARHLFMSRQGKRIVASTMRYIVVHPTLLRAWNLAYNRLSFDAKAVIHAQFCGLFREGDAPWIPPTSWIVSFCGKSIMIPLCRDTLWLDWDIALSVLGHDSDIKATYSDLISSRSKPDLFVDVGGNYGTHSLLFLMSGIETLTIEPNRACRGTFERICALNELSPHLEEAGLSDACGVGTLRYRERETWFGSTLHGAEAGEKGSLSPSITLRTLDSFASRFQGCRNILVKIDVEGSEAAVLRGGSFVLREHRPKLIFESYSDQGSRSELFDIFIKAGYTIWSLPLDNCFMSFPLSQTDFTLSRSVNFLAQPSTRQE